MSIRFVATIGCWAILGASAVLAEAPYQVTSYRQLGMNIPWAQPNVSMVRDADGNTLVAGTTWDSLNGPQQGLGDVFLRKYDAAGAILWTRQLGTTNYDENFSMAVDASGNAFITGRTRGALDGTNQGDYDTYLSKFDTSGTPLWTRQLGSNSYDYSYAVALDPTGNPLITGATGGPLCGPHRGGSWDVFLIKYDTSGTVLWKNQLGTGGMDGGNSLAVDTSGNVFISGYTGGPLAPPQHGYVDAFLAKYSATGALLSTKQFGTNTYNEAFAVAVDGTGNTFIAGRSLDTWVAEHSGKSNAFLSKIDASGALAWTKELGATASCDEGLCLAVDALGNVFMSGYTDGSLGGPNLGNADVFLTKFDTTGTPLWSEQLGTRGNDICSSLAVDSAGNLFLGGTNTTTFMHKDAFLYILSPVPEPGSIALLLAGVICLLAYAWHRRKAIYVERQP